MFLNDKTANEIKLCEFLFSVFIIKSWIIYCSLKWGDIENTSDFTWNFNKSRTLSTVN